MEKKPMLPMTFDKDEFIKLLDETKKFVNEVYNASKNNPLKDIRDPNTGYEKPLNMVSMRMGDIYNSIINRDIKSYHFYKFACDELLQHYLEIFESIAYTSHINDILNKLTKYRNNLYMIKRYFELAESEGITDLDIHNEYTELEEYHARNRFG